MRRRGCRAYRVITGGCVWADGCRFHFKLPSRAEAQKKKKKATMTARGAAGNNSKEVQCIVTNPA